MKSNPYTSSESPSPLAGRKFLITGGAGLIGSHIADLLVRDCDPEIVVLDNLTRGTRNNLEWAQKQGRVRLIEGDIRDRETVRDAMRGVDFVFHEAAIRITQCAEEPRLAMDVLVNGTYNVLEAAAEAGVQKVIAASSASVYGQAEEFPTTESHHPYANRTIYGAAKAFNEGLLRSFHEMRGLDYVALRYFNVYGPRMDSAGVYTEVMIRWMERLAAGKPCLIHGDGSQSMDFVFVEDVALANILAAKSPVTDEVFNVGVGRETSLLELATLMSRIMESGSAPEHMEARKVNGVQRRLCDTAQARERIGFEARFPLEEGLKRLVDWWSAGRPTLALASHS